MAEIIASRYEIIEKLGAGGGGNVFLADDLRLGKKIVLKADKRKATARKELLRREVDILKDLKHQHIPSVYDFFVENEKVYTVMDYIEGESLDKPLKRGERFSQPQVIEWAKELLDALCYLHQPTHGTPPRGFVHSDIKPANLMRRPDNSICLIDFNIALALGETNIVGCSAGYASPEHYGLDFSSDSETVNTAGATTVFHEDETMAQSMDRTIAEEKDMSSAAPSLGSSSMSAKRVIVPDVRSDIYSTGATLYHLLSGKRPARNALEVIPLSGKEFSPRLVRIITKAMNPNPDLRYQTAEEMLQDFEELRKKDPRVLRLKRIQAAGSALLLFLMAAGAGGAFVGLKRMETTESWLKLAEYSGNAFASGDTEQAVAYALEAVPKEEGLLTPPVLPQIQKALADALQVYDLSDGFKSYETVALPSAPFSMEIGPDGKTAACVHAYSVSVVDTETARIAEELPAIESALAEARYLDAERLLYAGQDGLTAYDLKRRETIWTGKPATAIAVSEDGKTAAAVYKDETFAAIYDTEDGTVKGTVDFEGRRQRVTVNDSFANPNDNLLSLNSDGTLLGVSFADGSLEVYDLEDPEGGMVIFDETSGYSHFEGGFYENYFAFSGTGASDSVFAVIDTETMEQTGGFQSESAFGVQTDGTGIYVQTENLLVRLHPVTGDQTPLVTTAEPILSYARGGDYTVTANKEEVLFFDKYANQISAFSKGSEGSLLKLAEGIALVGTRDGQEVRILKLENHPEAEIFSYDVQSCPHDEARLSVDGNTVMLFRYDRFFLYVRDGSLIKEVSIPDAEEVYDQQFIREGTDSFLEVTYNDGKRAVYSAADGSLVSEEQGEKLDSSLYEEFETSRLRIESPLHGAPAAYDKATGKLVRELSEDAYLTYVTETGDFLIAQYVTAEGELYGQLLDGSCQVLAELPYLCDVVGDTLIFDYPTGNLRESRIYNIHELIQMAQNYEDGRKEK